MHKMQKVKTVYIKSQNIRTKCQNISIVFSTPGIGVFLFARLCGNVVGMGTKSTVTGRRWGQNAAKGAGTGWGRGQEYILRGGNGVKHLSPLVCGVCVCVCVSKMKSKSCNDVV